MVPAPCGSVRQWFIPNVVVQLITPSNLPTRCGAKSAISHHSSARMTPSARIAGPTRCVISGFAPRPRAGHQHASADRQHVRRWVAFRVWSLKPTALQCFSKRIRSVLCGGPDRDATAVAGDFEVAGAGRVPRPVAEVEGGDMTMKQLAFTSSRLFARDD